MKTLRISSINLGLNLENYREIGIRLKRKGAIVLTKRYITIVEDTTGRK